MRKSITAKAVVGPRRRRTLSEARALVAGWRSSGLSKKGWCQRQGVPVSTLTSSLRRICGVRSTGFIAVHPPRQHPAAAEVASGLVVELGDVVRVTGLDIAGLVELVGLLRGGTP